MELYSTTLELWFGEYMYIDDEEWEDLDRVLSVKRSEEPAPYVMVINRNRRGPKGPHIEYVYDASSNTFVKRES